MGYVTINRINKIHQSAYFTHNILVAIIFQVDLLVKGEDLSDEGNLVDAYLNYKEGLIHMIAALQCKRTLSDLISLAPKQYLKLSFLLF